MATGRIGTTPVLTTRWSKAPAAGTTSLSGLDDNSVSLVYSVGYEAVYQNGVLLSRGNDYTATDGTTITLTTATVAGDIIEVFANQLVPLTDAISKGQFTAKGALLSASAASTPAVLTVGSNDQVLTADSSTATGLKWATPAAGGLTLLSTTTLTANTNTISAISGDYTHLLMVGKNISSSNSGTACWAYLNGDTGANYSYVRIMAIGTTLSGYAAGNTEINMIGRIAQTSSVTAKTSGSFSTWIMNYTATDNVSIYNQGLGYNGVDMTGTATTGRYDNSAAITSITIFADSGNMSGTVYLYGVK